MTSFNLPGRFIGALLIGSYFLLFGCSSCMNSEPPDSKSQSPQAIIEYFCKQWSDGDYDRMYGALLESVQNSITLERFSKEYKVEQRILGLPLFCRIIDREQDLGYKSLWVIEITYENRRVQPLTIQVWCEKQGKVWRIAEGALSKVPIAIRLYDR